MVNGMEHQFSLLWYKFESLVILMIPTDYVFFSERIWIIAVWPNSATKFTPGNNGWIGNNRFVVGIINDHNIAFFHEFEANLLCKIVLAKNEALSYGSPIWYDQSSL